jgi:hypothetical protein
MSASAMLLHRMLITGAGRGWKAVATSDGDRAPELTQTAPQGIVSPGWNSQQSQIVNSELAANSDRAESPHYLPTEQRIPPHA